MFGIGMPEMLMILAVALIVIGPKKLPDLAKSLGRALGEFKRATSDLKESIQSETGLDDVRDSFKEVNTDVRNALTMKDEPAEPVGAHHRSSDPETPQAAPADSGSDASLEASEDAVAEDPSTQSQEKSSDG